VRDAELRGDQDRGAQRPQAHEIASSRDEGDGHGEQQRARLHGHLDRPEAVPLPPHRERRVARGLEAERAVEERPGSAGGEHEGAGQDAHQRKARREARGAAGFGGGEQRRERQRGEFGPRGQPDEHPAGGR
jgi:hypothetical protein